MKLSILLSIILLSFCINPLRAQTPNVDSLTSIIGKLKEKILVDSIKKDVAAKYRNRDSVNYNARFDELKKDFLDLKMETSNIKLNLRKSQNEYRAGTIMHFVGIAMMVIAVVLPPTTVYQNQGYISTATTTANPLQVPFLLTGIASSLTGTVLWIDSRRLIGKAGEDRKVPKYRRAGY